MAAARDIDTLLAEVERLRAERRPFSDGLAQKVIDVWFIKVTGP